MKKYIPSIISMANLSFGFSAMLTADLQMACLFVLIAMVLDTMDGFLARALDATSDIGKELDSLCDMVSFGVVPAILYVKFSPVESDYLALVGIPYVVGAALRLAKFNTSETKSDFIGLASPFAALLLLGVIWGADQGHPWLVDAVSHPVLFALLPLIVAILMNINVEMFSLKGSDTRSKIAIAICAIIFVTICFIDIRLAAVGLVLAYIILSLILKLI